MSGTDGVTAPAGVVLCGRGLVEQAVVRWDMDCTPSQLPGVYVTIETDAAIYIGDERHPERLLQVYPVDRLADVLRMLGVDRLDQAVGKRCTWVLVDGDPGLIA